MPIINEILKKNYAEKVIPLNRIEKSFYRTDIVENIKRYRHFFLIIQDNYSKEEVDTCHL